MLILTQLMFASNMLCDEASEHKLEVSGAASPVAHIGDQEEVVEHVKS